MMNPITLAATGIVLSLMGLGAWFHAFYRDLMIDLDVPEWVHGGDA